ncbi:hypothetical protein RFI_33464 [Reticulomyxa filosa]|uniref:Uncharacterized protein n=1 Tax=Reticulomyxa filosa TaxID=46433 RepID=X6LPX5_RETFI|nr:hypothetical protein RFI_33464 [Reticulomyxa filosa]|eukprot:ETO03938.1 hypothetical protein RFI_33464 [Reticulomyxa filosa]
MWALKQLYNEYMHHMLNANDITNEAVYALLWLVEAKCLAVVKNDKTICGKYLFCSFSKRECNMVHNFATNPSMLIKKFPKIVYVFDNKLAKIFETFYLFIDISISKMQDQFKSKLPTFTANEMNNTESVYGKEDSDINIGDDEVKDTTKSKKAKADCYEMSEQIKELKQIRQVQGQQIQQIQQNVLNLMNIVSDKIKSSIKIETMTALPHQYPNTEKVKIESYANTMANYVAQDISTLLSTIQNPTTKKEIIDLCDN